MALSEERQRVPKQIFMLWDRGFEHSSAENQARWAKRSWELMNPDYKIRALNLQGAENLTGRSQYIPDAIWNNCTIQAKSDILRTLILYEHGGVWVDASLFCAVPLSSWLEDQPDLYSNLRLDSSSVAGKKRMDLDPWITSWFLVTPPRGYTISRVFEKVVDPEGMERRFSNFYFWWHLIVAQLAWSDNRVMRRITRFPSAEAAHCLSKDYWKTAPFLKKCATERFPQIIPHFEWCCLGNNQNNQTAIVSEFDCVGFDCSALAPNFKPNETENPSAFYV